MKNLTKALLEGFDSAELKEADMHKIEQAVASTKPEDTKYLVFTYDIDEDMEEVDLLCHGTEAIDDLDEEDEDLDNEAISKIEEWANNLAERIPALSDSVESEIESDWYSGMSVYGESGPYTYDGFTLALYIEED